MQAQLQYRFKGCKAFCWIRCQDDGEQPQALCAKLNQQIIGMTGAACESANLTDAFRTLAAIDP